MRAVLVLIALLVALTSPARAADDAAEAKSIIAAQVEAFSRDDAATAYSFASPLIHELFPQAEMFMSMVRGGYAPVYRHKSFGFDEFSIVDGKMIQRAHMVDADGVPWEALYTLERQDDGTLKISACMLLKVGLPA